MKKTILTIATLAAFSCAAVAQQADAGTLPAKPMPKMTKPSAKPVSKSNVSFDRDAATPVDDSTRLVEFNYDEKLVYNVIAQEGLMTHIELAPNEKVEGFYMSDASRWKHHISGDKSRVFVKPMATGLFNAATLVTTARTYELTFSSVGAGEPWYQRVRWLVNQFDMAVHDGKVRSNFEGVSEFARRPVPPATRSPIAMSGDSGGFDLSDYSPATKEKASVLKVRPEQLNFGYEISGKASFAPYSVFDDGKFTYLQLSDSPTMPAMFLLNEKGDMELINYVVKGNYLQVSQMVPGLLLKLGDEEVRITKRKPCSYFWCSK